MKFSDIYGNTVDMENVITFGSSEYTNKNTDEFGFGIIRTGGNNRQLQTLETVAPMVGTMFPQATSWFQRTNEVVFDCGYDVRSDTKITRFPPDEKLLNKLVRTLEEKHPETKFYVWYEDISGAVPSGIVAWFEDPAAF